jgi:quercetin dioxygenase-like cupin family protein
LSGWPKRLSGKPGDAWPNRVGQSTPTINTMWKIARALNCRISSLLDDRSSAETKVLRAKDAKVLTSSDGKILWRQLFALSRLRAFEFYELRLAADATECTQALVPGTVENLMVTAGQLEMVVEGFHYTLEAGDALQFEADVSHEYRNIATVETVIYLVRSNAEKS